MALHAVILAGGPGRRFWPWSTPETPKHALPLLAGGRSLFEDTVARLRPLAPPDRLWLVTSAPQAKTLRRLAPALKSSRILVEPEARDTAAAIGLAALRIRAVDPRAVMLVCPADHRIGSAGRFAAQARLAARRAALEDVLVTFGIRPDRPATAYGWIETGAPAGGGFRKAAAFREKPSAPQARRYLRSGNFLFNSGIFAWKAPVILEALRRNAPALLEGLGRLGPRLAGYGRLPKLSIDYAVLEKSPDVLVLPAAFPWSDWGTWTAWKSSLPADRNGNRVFGNARLDACWDCTAVGSM